MMTESYRPRPTAVTVLGWLFIIQSMLMLLGAVMTGAMSFTSHFLPHAMPPGEFPPELRLIMAQLPNFWVLGILQFCFAGITLVAAVAFLYLHGWARTLLEVLTWLWVISSVGYGIWSARLIPQMSTVIMRHGAEEMTPAAFSTVMAVGLAFYFFIILLIGGLVIYFLHSRTVREAMQPSPTVPAH